MHIQEACISYMLVYWWLHFLGFKTSFFHHHIYLH